MTASTNDLLQEARQAFTIGDVQLGSALLHKVFKQDINHQRAWELLYRELGRAESLAEFQRYFVDKYYPHMAGRLKEDGSEAENGEGGGPYRRVTLLPKKTAQPEAQPVGLIDFPGPKTGRQPDSYRIEPGQAPETREETDEKPKKRGVFRRIFGFMRRKPRADEPDKPTGSSPAIFPSGFDTPEKQPSITIEDLPAPKAEKRSKRSKKKKIPDSATILAKLGERSEIRLLIADDIPQTRENIRKLLLFEPTIDVVAVAATGQEVVDLALQHQPDIVLMDINMPGMDGLQALKLIRDQLPATQVIMLTVQDDPGYLREALQFGARDYLIKPPTIDDLLQTINHTHEIGKMERERRDRQTAPPETTAAVEPSVEGFAVAVYSPKGGAGCTLLASNLAVALHSAAQPAVLVDGDLQYGGVGLFFNEQAQVSILELAPRVAELDRAVIQDAVVQHEASGLHLILAPRLPEQAERISGEQLAGLIEYLKRIYPVVVVDTASVLDSQTSAVLETCDQILLLTTQDIPAIHDVRRALDYLPKIGVAVEKVSLVLNQYHVRVNITPEQIASNTRREFAAIIPLDNRTAIPSINRGMPFMAESAFRSLPIGQAIQKLAEHLRVTQKTVL